MKTESLKVAPCPSCRQVHTLTVSDEEFTVCQCGAVLKSWLAGWLIVSYRINPENWGRVGRESARHPG